MTDARIISVNPAEKSVGEKLLNQRRLANLSRCLSNNGCSDGISLGRCVNLFFGLNKKIDMQLSAKLFLFRMVCGVGLVASQLLPMHPDDIMMFDFSLNSLLIMAFGFSIFFGLFTRLSAIAASGWFGYLLYGSIAIGEPDAMLVLLSIISLGLWTFGPGQFSFDQLIRMGLIAIRKRVRKSASAGNSNGLDYRAYSSLEGRLV